MRKGLWDDKFLLGIGEIDKQHKGLVEMIETFCAMLSKGNYQAAQEFLLTKVKEYIEFHFSYEEAFQESIGYPQIEQHKKAHQIFVKEYEKVADEIKKGNTNAIKKLQSFLVGWLFTHIDKTDRKYADFYLSKFSSSG